MDQTLYKRLKPVVRRMQFRRVAISLAFIWCLGALIAIAIYFLNQNQVFDSSRLLWFVVGGTVLASLIGAANAFYHSKSVAQVAEELEKQFPDLDATLITAIEQQKKNGERLGFLQQDVLRRAVTHSYLNSWPAIIPGWHLIAAPVAGLIGLIAFGVAMIFLVFYPKAIPVDQTINFADAAIDQSNYEISVEPGNAEIERGTSLLVLARFAESIPPNATLVYARADGAESRVAMTKSLDDPVFGARVAAVETALNYRIEFAQKVTDQYDVTVFDYPKLVRADATLKYPEYTELKEKVVQDARRLSAVEGTTIDMAFFVNKPVINAWLFPVGRRGEGEPVELIPDTQDPMKLTAKIAMDTTQKYELRLIDEATRENRLPPKFTFNMLNNNPPDLKLTAPGRDIQASPLEEVQLSANAWDDFGLKSFGLNYGIAGQETKDLVLEQKAAGKKRKKVEHLMALEDLKAKPDDLVSYHFWAEDVGPDGNVRRVMSDMYFAEVRSFEEIFRQGQAPTADQQQQQQQQQQGQQGQNAQQAQELAELQKEIINGTWKVIRRELRDTVTEQYADDTKLLSESQTSAIALLDELDAELEDEQSKSYVEAARTFMNEAVLHLNDANRDENTGALKPALSSEQAAYQGLLKLRAREHDVVMQQQQQQQQQSSSQQQNRAQQQLDQLNLQEDENRYENEKTAQEQAQEAGEQQEERQVLSRLRELSRRQDDLNERVKELQTALEEVVTEEEREEIERRLKSLREQQEQMLRDTEELLDRMQQEENQQTMSEESEKLEEARESLQRASEALNQNEPSKAAAEGTRAQRDLEELRDEFQNRTAGQFTEEMRELRNEAQKLEEQEQEISKELAERVADQTAPESSADQAKPTAPSLREDETKDLASLEEKIGQQQLAVEELREKMRKTITEAEEFEPLLADDLYETYRKSEASRPDEALESARRSIQRGWADDAIAEEERARKGIEEMREGIEKAAESVLGDETKALKAAQEKLRDLNRELEQEIESQDPNRQSPNSRNANRREGEEGEPEEGGRANGEREREGQEREPREREPREGEAREGEAREGEPREGQGEGRDREREPRDQQEGRQGRGQGERDGERRDGEERERQEGEPREGEQEGQGRGQGEPQEGEPQEGQGRGQGEPQEGEPQEGQGRGQGEPQEGEPQEGQGGGNGDGERNRGGADNENETELERMQRQMRELSEQSGEGRGLNIGQNWGPGNQRMMRPISGDDFRDWSDRLRDVEEMIADPDLRAEASRIREQARELRKEMKERHSADPNWDLVKLKVAKPLAELKDRVAEEIMRRGSKDALVPLDRDPVPVEYQDAVRRYYERLGSGK